LTIEKEQTFGAVFPKKGYARDCETKTRNLKYREKFQISLEISRQLCSAVGNIGVISVRYQLPLCFLACKRFHGRGYLGFEKLFRGSASRNINGSIMPSSLNTLRPYLMKIRQCLERAVSLFALN
jgi:hypothetical protein